MTYTITYTGDQHSKVGDIECHRADFAVRQNFPTSWKSRVSYRKDMQAALAIGLGGDISERVMSFVKVYCYEQFFYELLQNNIASWGACAFHRPITPTEVLEYLQANMRISYSLQNGSMVFRKKPTRVSLPGEVFICLYKAAIFIPSVPWNVNVGAAMELEVHGLGDNNSDGVMKYLWTMEVLMKHFQHDGRMKSLYTPDKANLTRTNYEVMMIALKRASEEYLDKSIYWKVDRIRLSRVNKLEREVIKPMMSSMQFSNSITILEKEVNDKDRYKEVEVSEKEVYQVPDTQRFEAEWIRMTNESKRVEEFILREKEREEELRRMGELAEKYKCESGDSEDDNHVLQNHVEPEVIRRLAEEGHVKRNKAWGDRFDVLFDKVYYEFLAVHPRGTNRPKGKKKRGVKLMKRAVRTPEVMHGPINMQYKTKERTVVKTKVVDTWENIPKGKQTQEGWQVTANLQMQRVLMLGVACDFHNSREKRLAKREKNIKGANFGLMWTVTTMRRGQKNPKERKNLKKHAIDFIGAISKSTNYMGKKDKFVNRTPEFCQLITSEPSDRTLVENFTLRYIVTTLVRYVATESFAKLGHAGMRELVRTTISDKKLHNPPDNHVQRSFSAEMRRLLRLILD